jgi:D-alanyl-D-alanine carboxypeptidase
VDGRKAEASSIHQLLTTLQLRALVPALLVALLFFSPVNAPAQSPTKFGHHHFAEAPHSELALAGEYRHTGRKVMLRKPAATAFQQMVAAAKKDGVELIPISGFRTVEYQRGLFEKAIKKYGSEQGAAKWVAPPGYSEHNTGYTLDIGDGREPTTDVEPSFEHTAASKWLQQHAREFNFEMSFPRDNPQGINPEPWHWRWLGDDDARRTFHS